MPDVPEGATDIQIRTEALAAGRMYCVSFTASAEQRKQYLSQLDVHRSYALNINKLSQVLADWLPFESGMEVQAYIVKGHELAPVSPRHPVSPWQSSQQAMSGTPKA